MNNCPSTTVQKKRVPAIRGGGWGAQLLRLIDKKEAERMVKQARDWY